MREENKPVACPCFMGRIFGHDFVIEVGIKKNGNKTIETYECKRCGFRL